MGIQQQETQARLTNPAKTSVTRIDHITYAVKAGMLEKWAWYHIEVEGGKLLKRFDDVAPDNPNSSMRLWCIGYEAFWIALIEGIDRAAKSQVTLFADKHGDHAIQHVACDVGNLDEFVTRTAKYGIRFRGDSVQVGSNRQRFTKGHDTQDPAESTFTEYLSRHAGSCDARDWGQSDSTSLDLASKQAGILFYEQIENARDVGDCQPLVDFSAMPHNFDPR